MDRNQCDTCKQIDTIYEGVCNMRMFTYHHTGIPTTEPKEGERYSPTVKMYTTAGHNPFRIQWHRFEEGCPLHPLIHGAVLPI